MELLKITDWLPFAIFSYNTTPQSATKYTPYELIFGDSPKLPSTINNVEFKYTYDTFIDNLELKLTKSLESARENIINNKIKTQNYFNSDKKLRTFKIEQFIYLTNNQSNNKIIT